MRAETGGHIPPGCLKPVRHGWLCLACAAWMNLAAACADSGQSGPETSSLREGETTVYATNGARIYYTAKSESGDPILSSAAFGDATGPPAKACADCHGADGGGGAIPTDSGYVRTPPIAFARLASPVSYRGGRGFDEATLALTLRTGIRVDGYLLSPLMPRWQMSNSDMNDLIAHLKTFDAHAGWDHAR